MQQKFLSLYTDPRSPSFSNVYRSAISAGYSDQTARSLTHNNPKWLSESIGQIKTISPEQITETLTSVIYNANEPTYIKLKALELMMRHYNMLKQTVEINQQTVAISLDMSGR